MNVKSKACDEIESPKTPGGISKTLLTPCRRVGLSRNWRKSGMSPFRSPLSNSENINSGTEIQKISRKRKSQSMEKTDVDKSFSNPEVNTSIYTSGSQSSVEICKKSKKTKTLHVAEENSIENILHDQEEYSNILVKEKKNDVKELSTPKCKKKIAISPEKSKQPKTIDTEILKQEGNIDIGYHSNISETSKEVMSLKNKSPKNLTTECIIVLQNEMIDNVKQSNEASHNIDTKAQTIESDSDDAPLSSIRTRENIKVSNLKDKLTSTNDLKVISQNILKLETKHNKTEKNSIAQTLSQSSNSFIEDDDDVFDHKRTIVIRKCYDKVTKPSKAKSTGSITEKDINELRARIESKKKILMAKALGKETEDLRGLIKKWQKGCQDALMELLELMKQKMPEESNIGNAKLLQILKIPAYLIGYDAENDCFSPPNDSNILLSSLKI